MQKLSAFSHISTKTGNATKPLIASFHDLALGLGFLANVWQDRDRQMVRETKGWSVWWFFVIILQVRVYARYERNAAWWEAWAISSILGARDIGLLRRRDGAKNADVSLESPSLVEMKPEVPVWIFNKFLELILVFPPFFRSWEQAASESSWLSYRNGIDLVVLASATFSSPGFQYSCQLASLPSFWLLRFQLLRVKASPISRWHEEVSRKSKHHLILQ